MSNIVGNFFTGTSSHGNTADDDKDSLFWSLDIKKYQRGKFSMATVQGNSVLEDYIQVDTSPRALYFGVYDGHKRHNAANHLAVHLHKKILDALMENRNEMSQDILVQAITDIDKDFLKHVVEPHYHQKQNYLAKVGSCCLCGYITEDTLYLSHLGDSRAILAYEKENGELWVKQLTKEDMCDDPEIRSELELAHQGDPSIVIPVRGCYRVKGISKVTQTVGDAYLKWLPFTSRNFPKLKEVPQPFKEAVLTSKSHGYTKKIKRKHKFLIVASHEFWEAITNEEAVQIVNNGKKEGIAEQLLKTALEKLTERKGSNYQEYQKAIRTSGNRRDWHDDITVLVIFLHNRKKKRHVIKKEKVKVHCYRGRSEPLNDVSDFAHQDFGDFFTASD